MNTEKSTPPEEYPSASKEVVLDEQGLAEDQLASPYDDLDTYVKVMVSLRGGSRPILCW
jgi:hypothetical protein